MIILHCERSIYERVNHVPLAYGPFKLPSPAGVKLMHSHMHIYDKNVLLHLKSPIRVGMPKRAVK